MDTCGGAVRLLASKEAGDEAKICIIERLLAPEDQRDPPVFDANEVVFSHVCHRLAVGSKVNPTSEEVETFYWSTLLRLLHEPQLREQLPAGVRRALASALGKDSTFAAASQVVMFVVPSRGGDADGGLFDFDELMSLLAALLSTSVQRGVIGGLATVLETVLRACARIAEQATNAKSICQAVLSRLLPLAGPFLRQLGRAGEPAASLRACKTALNALVRETLFNWRHLGDVLIDDSYINDLFPHLRDKVVVDELPTLAQLVFHEFINACRDVEHRRLQESSKRRKLSNGGSLQTSSQQAPTLIAAFARRLIGCILQRADVTGASHHVFESLAAVLAVVADERLYTPSTGDEKSGSLSPSIWSCFQFAMQHVDEACASQLLKLGVERYYELFEASPQQVLELILDRRKRLPLESVEAIVRSLLRSLANRRQVGSFVDLCFEVRDHGKLVCSSPGVQSQLYSALREAPISQYVQLAEFLRRQAKGGGAGKAQLLFLLLHLVSKAIQTRITEASPAKSLSPCFQIIAEVLGATSEKIGNSPEESRGDLFSWNVRASLSYADALLSLFMLTRDGNKYEMAKDAAARIRPKLRKSALDGPVQIELQLVLCLLRLRLLNAKRLTEGRRRRIRKLVRRGMRLAASMTELLHRDNGGQCCCHVMNAVSAAYSLATYVAKVGPSGSATATPKAGKYVENVCSQVCSSEFGRCQKCTTILLEDENILEVFGGDLPVKCMLREACREDRDGSSEAVVARAPNWSTKQVLRFVSGAASSCLSDDSAREVTDFALSVLVKAQADNSHVLEDALEALRSVSEFKAGAVFDVVQSRPDAQRAIFSRFVDDHERDALVQPALTSLAKNLISACITEETSKRKLGSIARWLEASLSGRAVLIEGIRATGDATCVSLEEVAKFVSGAAHVFTTYDAQSKACPWEHYFRLGAALLCLARDVAFGCPAQLQACGLGSTLQEKALGQCGSMASRKEGWSRSALIAHFDLLTALSQQRSLLDLTGSAKLVSVLLCWFRCDDEEAGRLASSAMTSFVAHGSSRASLRVLVFVLEAELSKLDHKSRRAAVLASISVLRACEKALKGGKGRFFRGHGADLCLSVLRECGRCFESNEEIHRDVLALVSGIVEMRGSLILQESHVTGMVRHVEQFLHLQSAQMRAAMKVLGALLFHHASACRSVLPIIVGAFQKCLGSLQSRNTEDIVDVVKALERLADVASKTSLRYYGMVLVADFLTPTSFGDVKLRRSLLPGMFALLDSLGQRDFARLNASLDAERQRNYKEFYEAFTTQYKFRGKG